MVGGGQNRVVWGRGEGRLVNEPREGGTSLGKLRLDPNPHPFLASQCYTQLLRSASAISLMQL